MKKVLILDDLPDFLDLLQQYLEEFGKFEIVKSTDGNEALKKLKENKFDLICTDYKMPAMNGIDFVTNVRKNIVMNINTPIIFLSGLKPNLTPDEKIWENVFFVEKPFSPQQIKFIISCALRSK